MPSSDVVQKVLGSIKRRADYDYFFDKIESAGWILPLRENGLFSSPPSVERDGNYLKHPIWPESKYLSRMAEQAPEQVAETILMIPNTDNERVHEDFVEAAIKMQPDNAVKIAKKELKWIMSQEHFYFLYPSYVGELISYLAKNGKIRLAEDLAKALLDIAYIEREIGKPGDESYHKSTEIVPKFSAWEFGQVIEKNIPNLVDASGIRAFEMLCKLLEKALTKSTNLTERPYDYSWIWRRTIEDHEQNVGNQCDIKSRLVDAVRDAALQLIKIDNSNLPNIIAYLEDQPLLIYKRIAIYMLSQYINIQPELVSERLIDHTLFEDAAFRHEYAQLARAGFSVLSSNQQAVVFSWLENGPDIEAYKASVLDNTGRDATNDEIQAHIKFWQRDRLEQFKEHLTGDWQQRYEALVSELGEPEHPDFSSYSTSWVGPTSPKTSGELKQMSVEEIVHFLKEWIAPERQMDHSPEGLGRALASAISEDPVRFAENANLFKDLYPTYVRALFDGFREIPKSKSEIPWEPILDLSKWVVNQQREIQGRKTEYSDIDPGWVWARKSIANLLSNGLKNVTGEIQLKYRSSVWDVLLILTEDPDPSEEKYGEGHMDPSTLSINTVRGEAMHAVMNYGLWIVRHTSNGQSSTLELMPEVQNVLDKHLDTDIDPSLAIRSVYAQWFPWLTLMDTAWASQAKEKIFSSDSAQYWDAAWKTYVTFCQPYDDVLPVLREQYAFAVEKIGKPSTIEIDMANADQRLTEHLMIYFWRGKLDIDDSLIQSFYRHSTTATKEHAIEYLGRSLRNFQNNLPVETFERLKSFWEWRYDQALEHKNLNELAEFCWWFSSGTMDTDWAVTELKKVLNLQVKLDGLDFVAEELVKLISEKPSDVLECLDLMLNHLSTKGVYFSWNDEARQILSEAMGDENETIKAQATAIIHKLGAMGYFEFRSLL